MQRFDTRRRALAHLGRAAIASALAIAAIAAAPAAARAEYPDRPVTLIVAFAPGGPTDIIARILGAALSKSLGQQFIVDNRPGASGNIGMAAAARAKPDGYTLLLASTAIAVNQAFAGNLNYDPVKDFTPISELVNSPSVVIVRSDSGIESLADLIKQAKANPEKFNYASPGVGTKSHLSGELLKLRAGINMVHVPFRGAGPSTQAVLAGTTQVGVLALPPAEPLIKHGKLKALAVTGGERWFSLPDVPTMIEAGFPNFVSVTFSALFAPAGTPPDVIAILTKATREAFKDPAVRDAARKAGFEVVAGTPEQLKVRLADEIPAVKELVNKAGITRK
jgi:tripartite-type tricarboxylate transporter receptor subunit TctC